jgi:putative peptide zinc metalloprotease protein
MKSEVASSEPPSNAEPTALPVRRRPDLVIVRRDSQSEARWTVKDPVTQRFFELGAYERFVLEQLDCPMTPDDLEARFARQFAPHRLSRQQMLEFIGRLWQQGLLVSLSPGAGGHLAGRRQLLDSPPLFQRLSQILVIRTRGVDPDRFLSWLHGWLGWIYSTPVLILALGLIVSAVLAVAMEFDAVLRAMPDFQSFLNVKSAVTGAIVFGLIKVLHELGHGLTCKHFGGECHELGLMWLVVTPAMYCNVSDAWLLSNRWHRAAIGAAGIIVELVLAAVCTFLWWFSEPGAFHDVCFWVMTIGSLNTLLVNGNPLLRYDGYYVLADLLNISNFRTRAQKEVGATLSKWVFGVRQPRSRSRIGERLILLSYGVASWVYQWVVLIGILWFLYHLARPVGLDPVIVGLGLVLVGLRLMTLCLQVGRQVAAWWKGGQMRAIRFSVGVAVVAVIGGLAMSWPLPFTVQGPGLIEHADAQPIFATTPGALESAAAPGAVRAGETLVVLKNPEVEMEILRLRGAVERQTQVVENLSRRVVSESYLAAQLAVARTALTDQQERLHSREREAQHLTLKAPIDGYWWPALTDSISSLQKERTLRSVAMTDSRVVGTWIPAGTTLAVIAPTDEAEVRVLVEQSDVPFVRPQQVVRVKLAQASGRVLSGKVVEVAQRNLESAPVELVKRQELAAKADHQALTTRDVVYEVRVRLDGDSSQLVAGGSVEAKIEVGTMSLWQRLVRFLQLTFRIRESGR